MAARWVQTNPQKRPARLHQPEKFVEVDHSGDPTQPVFFFYPFNLKTIVDCGSGNPYGILGEVEAQADSMYAVQKRKFDQ